MKKLLLLILLALIPLFSFKNVNAEDTILATDYETAEEEYITFSSSVSSDLENLDIEVDNVTFNHVVTISEGYVNVDGELQTRKFCYYYFVNEKYLNCNDPVLFSAYVYEDNFYSGNEEDYPLEVFQSRIISGEKLNTGATIYKAMLVDNYENVFNNSFKIRIRNINILSTNHNYTDCQQDLYVLTKTEGDTRTFSCYGIDHIKGATKGSVGYLVFQADNRFETDDFWPFSTDEDFYTFNKVGLWFYFFDAYKDGEKITDSANIEKIEYHATSYKLKLVVEHRAIDDGERLLVEERYDYQEFKDVVYNEKTTFTYPTDLTVSNFFEYIFDTSKRYNDVTYEGIFKTSDTKLNDFANSSENSVAKELSKYTFACRVGNKEGYPFRDEWSGMFMRNWTRVMDRTVLRVIVKPEIDTIYFQQDGNHYVLEVDVNDVKMLGNLGDEEDIKNWGLPIEITLHKKPDRPSWLKAVIAILIIVLTLWLVVKIIKKRRSGGSFFGGSGSGPYNKVKQVKIVQKRNGKKVTNITENITGAGFNNDSNNQPTYKAKNLIVNDYNDNVKKNPYRRKIFESKKKGLYVDEGILEGNKKRNYEVVGPLPESEPIRINNKSSKNKNSDTNKVIKKDPKWMDDYVKNFESTVEDL